MNNALCFLIGAILTVGFYGILGFFPKTSLNHLFTQRGIFQYVAVFIASWALVTVVVKWGKIKCKPVVPEYIIDQL